MSDTKEYFCPKCKCTYDLAGHNEFCVCGGKLMRTGAEPCSYEELFPWLKDKDKK
jgi:hypothetical protein